MRRILCAATAALALASCGGGFITLPSAGKPLTQDQVQQNLANVLYLMKATGCLVSEEAAVAAPVIAIAGDAQGNQVLTAVGTSGGNLCTITVPPTALPVPAPANAPAASAPAAS